MSLHLSELIDGFPVRRTHPGPGAGAGAGSGPDPEVSGVHLDSRRVAPGYLFVAVAGERADGRRFAPDAVGRGAVAVLAAPGPLPGEWGPSPPVPWLETLPELDGPRPLAGPLAARAYAHPERELIVSAVTGTNGKSTVTALMVSVLEAAGHPTGHVGTLGYGFRDDPASGERTTPEAPETLRLMRRWRDRGAEAVSMEASSHALALDRLAGIELDAAVFTNLSQDHLDWHEDLEAYYAAKRRLFDLVKERGGSAINVDDPWGRRLAEELAGAGRRVVTYGGLTGADRTGERPGAHGEAAPDVRVRNVEIGEGGTGGTLETPRGAYAFRSPLLGRYNLENLLAAAAAAEVLGLEHGAVAAGFAARGPVAGRLEPVSLPEGQPFPVYVDYAHGPGALEALLRSVRELSGRRIIVVFGAGGDRDRAKRRPMGRIAGELAELPILTSDNPRTEDPLEIVRTVELGLEESGNQAYRVVPDRREAIRRAVAVAGPGDVLVITGKGHETVQEIGGERLPFSDKAEVLEALEERFGETANR